MMVVAVMGKFKANDSLHPSLGPLIFASPDELTVSLAINVEKALNGATEKRLQVLFTSYKNKKRIVVDNTLSNKLLAITSNLQVVAQNKHNFTGGYWQSMRISSDTVLLSINILQSVALSRSVVENIIESGRGQLTKYQIKIEPPSMERLLKELKTGRSYPYLNNATQNINKIIAIISSSGKVQRSEINELACVLSFCNSQVELLAELNTYLKLNLLQLESLTQSKRADHTLRIIDSLLYLMFELTDKHSLSELSLNITSAIELLKNKGLQPTMFSRALRQSFLKGCDLSECLPTLIDVMMATETDDAAGFLIIFELLRIAENQSESKFSRGFILNIFKISPKGLVLLARDLRRTIPLESNASIISHDHAISWLNQYPDRQTSLAKCLVLHYVKTFTVQTINWVKHNHLRIGLEERDVVSLTALSGFDVPFFLEINKGLFKDGFTYKFISPSKCRLIADYFEKNLVEWEKIRANSGFCLDMPHAPLVSVVFTTYNADIKLFAHSLRSILLQSYPNLEVIVIDDHSSADTSDSLKKIINAAQANYPHSIVYKRNEKNTGQYVSRNIAIAMAKGVFIAIQDDDDISHPERLSKQIVPMLMNSAIQATHAWHIRIGDNSKIMIDGDALGEILGDAPVSVIYRKCVFDQIGLFLPTKTRGDIEFRTRLRRHYGNASLYAIPHPLILMRGGMGTISADKEYYYRSALSAFRYVLPHIPSDIVKSEEVQRYIPNLLQ
jgi:hypothetical protein